LQVVSEYEAGVSVPDLRLKYGIGGGNTIGQWIEKYGREGYRSKVIRIQKADEFQELKALKKKIVALEAALSESILENRMLNATIEAANKEFRTDLKKNYAKKS
jgi:transposase-like protein